MPSLNGNSANPFIENKKYFNSPISEFVYLDKYARYSPEKGRREIWPETVERVINYLRELSKNKLPEYDYKKIHDLILSGDISPSMRLFKVAGKEAWRHPESIFNCGFLPIVGLECFGEILYLSTCGVGLGYSVEQRYTNLLPEIGYQTGDEKLFMAIEDSAEGWVRAFDRGLRTWWSGGDIEFDYSLIRPAGSPLKTKGGTASGPGVLRDLMNFTRSKILDNQGKKLRPIDVSDIVCNIANCAVSGGSRRSALLCSFDFDDQEMRLSKQGEFWKEHPYRANANISVTVEDKLGRQEISDLLGTMLKNRTGEPGWTSRRAANLTRPEGRRELTHGGQNACSEINLQGATADGRFGGETCNLSTAQVYPHDTSQSLREKIEYATIIGTIQSIATDYFTNMLRPEWREIGAEERLLGVSIIGVMDKPDLFTEGNLRTFKQAAIETNELYAQILGINKSASITTLKPAGNSSVMYGVARGINARYAPHYIRRVRVGAHTPMYNVLNKSGVPIEPENGQENWDAPSIYVATFYESAPDGAVCTSHIPAVEQLETWKKFKINWCTHNISITCEYSDNEIEGIVEWVNENQDIMNGISFLPRSNGHVFKLAPYEKITENEYKSAIKNFPQVDFSLLQEYEHRDMTIREIECSANVCDLV